MAEGEDNVSKDGERMSTQMKKWVGIVAFGVVFVVADVVLWVVL